MKMLKNIGLQSSHPNHYYLLCSYPAFTSVVMYCLCIYIINKHCEDSACPFQSSDYLIICIIIYCLVF